LIQIQPLIAVLDELPKEVKLLLTKADCRIKKFSTGKALESYMLSQRIDICLIPYDKELIDRIIYIDSEMKLIILSEKDKHQYNPNLFFIDINNIDEYFIFNLINFIRTSRLRDDFIGTLLHDARSPINSMIGYLELLENGVFGELEEGQSKILFNIMTLGDMVIELIDDLNMLYQIDNKAFQIKRAPFSFPKTLEEVLIAAWVLADKKDIKIHKEIATEIPKSFGDSGKIQRVMMNLIINAIKFSPEKSTIIIGLNHKPESTIVFSVSDEGPGIQESEISAIFNKYYHNREISKIQRGFGLGLYISKYIIEEHKGKIWVENNPAKGATFFFSLPIDN
jgi:signal transduction histidine kinase